MRRWLCVCVAMMWVGCGPAVTDPMPDIPEHVEYDTVRINYGEPAVEDGPITERGQALVGEASGLARVTRDAVKQANELIYEPFALIDAAIRFPPSRYEEETWIWETRAGAMPYMRLELRLATQAEIDAARLPESAQVTVYRLYYGASASDNQPFYEAIFGRAPRRQGRQQGAGVLRMNFDALRAYKPDAARGEARLAFRVNGGVRQVVAAYRDVQRPSDPEPLSSVQRYVELPGGQGQLEFAAKADWRGDGAPLELTVARSRWTRERAGRIAARMSGGSLQINELLLDQCWDESAVSVWEQSRPVVMGFGGGDEGDCALVLGRDLVAPDRPQMFNGDPDIPARHPQEE